MDFIYSQEFKDALEKSTPTLFINPGMPEVSWEEILNFINKNYKERLGWEKLPSKFAMFYNRAERMPTVNIFVKKIYSMFKLNHEDPHTVTSQLFGTLLIEDGTNWDPHDDSENNLFWQIQGRSRWKVYSSYDNKKPYMDIIVDKGDVLFVPAHTIHSVIPEEPRACIAILFDKEKI